MSNLEEYIRQLITMSESNYRQAISNRNQYNTALKNKKSSSANIYYVKYLHFYQKAIMYKLTWSLLDVCYNQQKIIDRMSLEVLKEDKAVKELQKNFTKSIEQLKELIESETNTAEE